MQNIERERQAWKELVKRNVADWSKNEVQMFMRNIGLNTYEGVFNQNKVTGSVLVRLSTTDFHQLGLSYPHTMRVVKALFLAKHFQSTEAPPGILHWTMNDVKDWLTKNNFQSLIATFTKTQVRCENSLKFHLLTTADHWQRALVPANSGLEELAPN